MFLFVIKRCLNLVFHRLKIQIAWDAFLVKKNPDLLMLISTDLTSYSAVQQSCTPSSTCPFIFFRCGEPYPFFNDRAFQNSNCSERRRFQIMRFWRMIGKWLGIGYRDWCGNKMGWRWCFLSSNLKFHQKNIGNFTFNSR